METQSPQYQPGHPDRPDTGGTVSLRPESLAITALYLDPNNPRFADLDQIKPVADEHVADPVVQDRAMSKIMNPRFEVEQLKESVESIGFLPIDRLVVVELPEQGRYKVVEGNRRLAALKALYSEHVAHETTLAPHVLDSIATVPVLVIDAPDNQLRDHYARIYQGVRHLASVRSWGPYQQAQLVGLMLEEGKSLQDIKEVLGMSKQRITSLRRVYYAMAQMQEDDEYAEYVKPNLFSHFEEALGRPDVRKWLEWDDNGSRANSSEHLSLLYSWIVGPEVDGSRLDPKVNDAKDFRFLPAVLGNARQWARFLEEPHLSLRDAARGVTTAEPEIDWRSLLDGNLATLRKVPAVEIARATDSDIELLASVRSLCDELLETIDDRRARQVADS